MRTERVTVLMRPEEKAALETAARASGLSAGEYIRASLEDFGTPEERALLRDLVAELDRSMPSMLAAFDQMSADIQDMRTTIAESRAGLSTAG